LPDVSRLLEDERPPLRQFEQRLEGEVIRVDETLPVDGAPRFWLERGSLAWSSLCWLCWATGVDGIELPRRVRTRPELQAALELCTQRSQALTGFEPRADAAAHFHELDETVLPASALALLAQHYREARAMLLFACDPECVSPWQDDLGR
jgi:hypothetical protein